MGGREYKLVLGMLGTGQHRDTFQDVLTSLVDSLEVDAKQSVHLIDGPGGVNKHPAHPMLGNYTVRTAFNPATGKITVEKTLKPEDQQITALNANITGAGGDDAILEARSIVAEMLKAGKSPLVIDMFGFSRGADNCLRTANILYALYGDAVKVNIFAIDPVPGTGRQGAKKARIIPPNVKEYRAILMQDERQIILETQNRSHLVVQDPQKTRLKYYIYRGNHGFAHGFGDDPDSGNPIVESPRLLWDELRRFAKLNKLRLKHNKLPPYVIDKPDKLDYIQAPAKALSDKERLASYTRMSINEQAYLDAVAKKKTHVPIRADREFIDRKVDYILHGTNCFQDREHMLLFKQHFPAVFDYYFQYNIGKVSNAALQKELADLNADAELKQFMLERAGIDPAAAPANPQGVFLNADIFYTTTSDLRQIWEGVVEAVGAVVVNHDDSVSKTRAQNLQDRVHAILIGPKTESNKITEIKKTLADEAIALQHNKGGDFAYKLATIADSLDQMDETLAERLARKMDEYIQRSEIAKLFHSNKSMGATKKAVFSTAQRRLKELADNGVGNDIKQIQIILNTLYAAAGEIRSTHAHPTEGKYEDTLREYAVQISNYAPKKHPSDAEKKAKATIVNPIMNAFHHEIHINLAKLREPKLQSYTKAVNKFLGIAKHMLASRADIKAVDKALATCTHLQYRLQGFDIKLWEDDASHQTIASYQHKLTDMQTRLETAKTELDTKKTYTPDSVLYFSQRSQVVSAASPDQLDAEVAKVLAQDAPAAQYLGDLSDTAPLNTTDDFVHDKARVNFSDITTGVGVFAKTTTVKSVQLMRDNVYKLESYFDPAQLSRFGTKGYLEWAMSEIDNFRHTNPMDEKHVLIQGDYPEKYVRYAIAYCQLLNLPYTNLVKPDEYLPTSDDIKKVRKEMEKPSRVSIDRQISDMNLSLRKIPEDVKAIPTGKIK